MDNVIIKQLEGFDWDEGSSLKNWQKHSVTKLECEQIFFNQPILLSDDIKHSEKEKRYLALGRTDQDKKLFLVFTVRNNLIRVISARLMNKKERGHYEKA